VPLSEKAGRRLAPGLSSATAIQGTPTALGFSLPLESGYSPRQVFAREG